VSAAGGENLTYRVFATDGALVGSASSMSERFEIDLSSLPAGLYFLQVGNGPSVINSRFVKE
jgi:hypothetical protein